MTWTPWGLRAAVGIAVYRRNTGAPTCAAANNVSHHTSIAASNILKMKSGSVSRTFLLDYKNHARPARVLWTMPSH
jgi:hypothetical protein